MACPSGGIRHVCSFCRRCMENKCRKGLIRASQVRHSGTRRPGQVAFPSLPAAIPVRVSAVADWIEVGPGAKAWRPPACPARPGGDIRWRRARATNDLGWQWGCRLVLLPNRGSRPYHADFSSADRIDGGPGAMARRPPACPARSGEDVR